VLITLNIPTLGHRPGDTIEVDDNLAADLVAGGHAVFAVPVAPDVVLAPEAVETVEAPSRRRAGKVDEPTEPTPEP